MKSNKFFQEYIINNTDKYFSRTKAIVESNGDKEVVYAFFLRTKSIYAPLYIENFLQEVKKNLKIKFEFVELYKSGEIIPKLTPFFFLKGSFKNLCELETHLLQKIGIPCVAAYNAYVMGKILKHVAFISMGARHCPNSEVSNMIDYGISVGSTQAQKEGAKGFIGSSTNSGSYYFGLKEGLGTMPHALIGYAGSTLEAAKMYNKSFPHYPLVVLVDFFGKEITDSLQVCNYFKDLARMGNLSIRIDTHGSRYLQGLDEKKSWLILKKYVKSKVISNLKPEELNYLIGKGVSGAAIFALKEALIKAGFPLVKIVVSSGFNLDKCLALSKINVPIDVIGTGSLLSTEGNKIFATADIISYNNTPLVKKGREYLIKTWNALNK